MDAALQRAGREHDRHESPNRQDEEEDFDGAEQLSPVRGPDHARLEIPDSVHSVDRRKQEIPDPAAEIERHGHET